MKKIQPAPVKWLFPITTISDIHRQNALKKDIFPVHLLAQLPVYTLGKLAMVSRAWRELIDSDPVVSSIKYSKTKFQRFTLWESNLRKWVVNFETKDVSPKRYFQRFSVWAPNQVVFKFQQAMKSLEYNQKIRFICYFLAETRWSLSVDVSTTPKAQTKSNGSKKPPSPRSSKAQTPVRHISCIYLGGLPPSTGHKIHKKTYTHEDFESNELASDVHAVAYNIQFMKKHLLGPIKECLQKRVEEVADEHFKWKKRTSDLLKGFGGLLSKVHLDPHKMV